MQAENLVLLFGLLNTFIFFWALWQSAVLKNPFGRCHMAILGSFVWGDAVIISLYWIFLSVIYFFIVKDLDFFLFAASIFFAVRGFGETVYWLNQQFSKISKNPPKSFWMERLFPGEAVWFAYQLLWQVVTAISLIFSVYFGFNWIGR